MQVLVVGAGVIGSVYAGKLLQAGHDVELLARGRRLADLRAHGLVLEDATAGRRTVLPVPVVAAHRDGKRYDLVLVPVQREQLTGTLPLLTAMAGHPDVLFFGNAAGRTAELTAALGDRALFGFPAAGGVRDGEAIRYALIPQQKTMLADPGGPASARVARLREMFHDAGFPTREVPAGVRDATPYSHYALLRSIEARFGLAPLGHAGDPVTATIPAIAAGPTTHGASR